MKTDSVRCIFGFRFLNGTMSDAILAVSEFQCRELYPTEPLVFTPNLDIIIQLEKLLVLEPTFVERLKQSYLVLPDGFPIVLAAGLLGMPLKRRLTGADLMQELVDAAVGKKFLIVVPDVITGKRLRTRMEQETKNNVEYLCSPHIKVGSMEFKIFADQLAGEVADKKPDYVILSLGFPKQEFLAFHVIDYLRKHSISYMPLFFGLGAAAEFYAGTKPRAPKWIQSLKLEWLYRLLHEPRRLFFRYMRSAAMFIPVVMREYRNQQKSDSGHGESRGA